MLGPALSTWGTRCVPLCWTKNLHLLGESAGERYIGSIEDVGSGGWIREASLLGRYLAQLFHQSLAWQVIVSSGRDGQGCLKWWVGRVDKKVVAEPEKCQSCRPRNLPGLPSVGSANPILWDVIKKLIIGEDKKRLIETIDQRKGSEVIANEDFVEFTCPVFDHHLVHPSPWPSPPVEILSFVFISELLTFKRLFHVTKCWKP